MEGPFCAGCANGSFQGTLQQFQADICRVEQAQRNDAFLSKVFSGQIPGATYVPGGIRGMAPFWFYDSVPHHQAYRSYAGAETWIIIFGSSLFCVDKQLLQESSTQSIDSFRF